MADIAEKPNFEDLCIKCEQMELDVSKIESYLKNRFSSTVLHIPFYFLYVCLFIIAEFALSECTGYANFSLISAHF